MVMRVALLLHTCLRWFTRVEFGSILGSLVSDIVCIFGNHALGKGNFGDDATRIESQHLLARSVLICGYESRKVSFVRVCDILLRLARATYSRFRLQARVRPRS